ncbi:MAG: endonuclease/exonuclease/phosphatase family protein [Pirellulales bacterium]|nr:endonuclease/exonuclease/phosphatase family protein [Pirellulales bacterium]
MRWTAKALHILIIGTLGLFIIGCGDAKSLLEKELARQATQAKKEQSKNSSASLSINPSRGGVTPSAPVVAGDTIRIATFNIQVFGISKSKKPQVMDTLAKVVRRFDLVAVQEVRTTDHTLVPQFVDLINAEGGAYRHVIGPRLGRTASKEQYAYIFDSRRIAVDTASLYTVPDPDDYLHREPFVGRFSVRCSPDKNPFTFNLINIHTDPDETGTELNALDDIFVSVQNNASREDDVILLGDLNVDYRHLGELGRLPDMAWVVTGQNTNTRLTKSYDNILFNRRSTSEFTGRWGILNLMDEFGLSKSDALRVSDHMPVWAEFSAFEAPAGQRVAVRPGSTER